MVALNVQYTRNDFRYVFRCLIPELNECLPEHTGTLAKRSLNFRGAYWLLSRTVSGKCIVSSRKYRTSSGK